MTGNPPQKVARLLAHLIKQPKYLLPYIKTNILRQTSALELELPWISYEAIDFLSGFVKKEMSVFEYGSGGSTLFFARKAASVVSIEDNTVWFDRVKSRLTELRLSNVELQYQQFDFKQVVDFERSAYLNSIPAKKFDILVVDGTEEAIQVRPQCFYHAENFVRKGGIIVVDDSWRYLELRYHNHAKKGRIFQSVGPCRPGVTSTDIFFY
jgi:predicted O-methyltransferase YrrM